MNNPVPLSLGGLKENRGFSISQSCANISSITTLRKPSSMKLKGTGNELAGGQKSCMTKIPGVINIFRSSTLFLWRREEERNDLKDESNMRIFFLLLLTNKLTKKNNQVDGV